MINFRAPVYHQYITNISPIYHQYITSISPIYHQYIPRSFRWVFGFWSSSWGTFSNWFLLGCKAYTPLGPSPLDSGASQQPAPRSPQPAVRSQQPAARSQPANPASQPAASRLLKLLQYFNILQYIEIY